MIINSEIQEQSTLDLDHRDGNIPAEDLTPGGTVKAELESKLETDTLCMRVFANNKCELTSATNINIGDTDATTYYLHPLTNELLKSQKSPIIKDVLHNLSRESKNIKSELFNGAYLIIIDTTCYLHFNGGQVVVGYRG